MKFISYAQNFEDVILWRALKHVEHGFYVDVGAFSPIYDSVTKAFYEAGWSGINIEPNPEFKQVYKEHRPRDIHICAAVSDTEGQQDIFFVSNGGLTSLDQRIAEGHKELGWTIQPQKTQTLTLGKVLGEHAISRNIHFLKIDVEGLEEKVIRGNDWTKYRPWILVVEATLPMSKIENHGEWEPLLLSNDYRFVYADGLNRFYVAGEHIELVEAFNYPPNVFDEFVRYDLIEEQTRAASAQDEVRNLHQALEQSKKDATRDLERIDTLQTQLAQTRKEFNASHQQCINLEAQRRALTEQIQTLLHSTSWRITRPLRALRNLLGQRH